MSFKIKPISQITPSAIHIFYECSLHGVLIANHNPSLLPKSPSAVVGTIIHRMMNTAAMGEISGFDDFKKIWEHYLHEEEEKMLSIPISKHLVPLNRSLRDLSARKKKCWDSVRPVLKDPPIQLVSFSSGSHKDNFDIPVSTPENDVAGFIDAIIKTPSGPQLIDYKSGNACIINETGIKKIKPDYVLQLKLYAALYYFSFNQWPVSPLKIIEIGGQEFDVPYDQNEVKKIVQTAKNLIKEINTKIQQKTNDLQRLEREFSNPSPESCKFCVYRPGCNSYWEKRAHDSRDTWPNDVCGTITSVEKQGNGLLSIKINQRNRVLGPAQIRGISPLRHLSLLVGKNYAFYNLQRDLSLDHYKEGILTTIYTLE